MVQVADDAVFDEAGLYSRAALAAARDTIRQIRKEYHCAVLVETVSHAPPGQSADLDFHNWAKERSRQFNVEGIYILLCKQPRRVAVVVWPEEHMGAKFTPADRAGVERLITRSWFRSQDRRLSAALDRVRADLEAHRQVEPQSVALGPLTAFIASAVGVWLVLALVRLWWRKPDPFSFTGQPESVRLTAGLLAGMFGNPVTHWITDRLFPKETLPSQPDGQVEDVPPVETPSATAAALQDALSDPAGSK
jgi:hypothetical protein